MFFLILHPVRPVRTRRAYFFGTQLGTVFPAFFFVPICSYPSQHGFDGFFDAAFFLAAVFLVVAIRFYQTRRHLSGDLGESHCGRGNQGDRVYAERLAVIAARPRPRREGGAQKPFSLGCSSSIAAVANVVMRGLHVVTLCGDHRANVRRQLFLQCGSVCGYRNIFASLTFG